MDTVVNENKQRSHKRRDRMKKQLTKSRFIYDCLSKNRSEFNFRQIKPKWHSNQRARPRSRLLIGLFKL